MEWQPIATVPIGKEILVTDGSKVSLVSAEIINDLKGGIMLFICEGVWTFDADSMVEPETATHWMYIPALPKGESA